MKKFDKKPRITTAKKLQRAAKLATIEAKRENKALGLSVLVAKKDGLYLVSNEGKEQLVKKGNYNPVKVPFRSIKIAK